jgi:hypothetical protein
MSKGLPRGFHSRRKSGKRDAEQLAAELAPLEEQKQREGSAKNGAAQQHGAIVVDKNNLSIDPQVGDVDKASFKVEPVVLVILVLMLGYIAYIAWEISQMPAP